MQERPYLCLRVYQTQLGYLQMYECQCQQRLQFSREAITNLCAMLQDTLRPIDFSGNPMPVALKITIALNCYAFGSFQGFTMCGIAQAADHHCIKEMTNALFKRAGNYVQYETDPDSQAEQAIGFVAIAGFPQVQGVIDCTDEAIKASTEQAAAFINMKSFHSINLLLVYDHQKHILQVCACFLGSSHDATYFNSPRCHSFSAPCLPLGMDSQGQRLSFEDKATHARGELHHFPRLHSSDHRAGHWATEDQIPVPESIRWSPAVCPSEGLAYHGLHNLALQRGEALHEKDMIDRQYSSNEQDVEEATEQTPLDINSLAPETGAIERRAVEAQHNLIHTHFLPP
ncbi:putative nuclease HARBI1 [Heterodontus francisci]|uniref:putative nuclease HARBI1 n=1 Tax=Heterodontus francisci TaxID=7792 RepID=UPI00355C7023